MGRMKEIYTGVMEIIEDIDNRLKDKSEAYKIVLINSLIQKLVEKRSLLIDGWRKKEGFND